VLETDSSLTVIPTAAWHGRSSLTTCGQVATAAQIQPTGSASSTSNLLQPIVLAFVLGAIAGFIKSELEIGSLATDRQWQQISPLYEGMFRGILMLFLLEMGITAARQAKAFRAVGPFMVGFGVLMPLFNGVVGVTLGHLAGVSLGGAFVFGAICASASFIDAPAACRASLPEANPGIYLTSSLAVTLPFNLLLGLPLYYKYALWLYGT